ncbi:N-formylglutamate amidohydrolase [Hoeflea prorocentri]|uniref:N-formylglutamate amidohydrolase n=1 Tax=Hoeflea prorocentri TaxID=1922333 RepID=A0A9X3UK67_9HYPH|nr:N-formylglutamate amidohydrolase [Hoeflea prorocentri]MCY6382315.1 N-formylglutamate amidohydrolase [Hoeflea prorocentri]MDA5400115.1 N-formylglutamate amidohydrolase [Hoeflea prorocentri]
MKETDQPVARVVNATGDHPVVLICEHASSHIPAAFGGLGLSGEALSSHIAWDPGALETAERLSALLKAPLVHGQVSRLIYDCNRPPEAPGAMPEKSEIYDIPGNRGLDGAERARRVETYYRPFEKLVEETLKGRSGTPVLVTIHSFTPVFDGKKRSVEIGILHDADTRLADALLSVPINYKVQRNQPYGPADGVTHTLQRHALPGGLLNVMIEIRNDLIATPEDCAAVAQTLSSWLERALAELGVSQVGGAVR